DKVRRWLPGFNQPGLRLRLSVGRAVAVEFADQGVLDQLRLLGLVGTEMAAGRRRRARATGIVHVLPILRAMAQVVLDLVPGALVHGFFLAPDQFLRRREALQLLDQRWA